MTWKVSQRIYLESVYRTLSSFLLSLFLFKLFFFIEIIKNNVEEKKKAYTKILRRQVR